MVNDSIISRLGERLTKAGGGLTATDTLEKLQSMVGYSHSQGYGSINAPQPPYERYFSPLWIYKIRRDQPLMANAIQKKVAQTYQNGWTEWEKAYNAKCPACLHEFQGLDKFRKQMGDAAEDISDEEIDLDTERACPECEEVVEMLTPDEDTKHRCQEWLDRCNTRDDDEMYMLEPTEQSSVSQSAIDLLFELSLDMQSFDDAWMIFERSYDITQDGEIVNWDLENIMRGPPELMRYSINEETQEVGGEYWVCIKCRAEQEEYHAQEDPGKCEDCGRRTYEAFAMAYNQPQGQVMEYFIRGEFAHDNEFMRKRWYGYPPVLTLWEESRTVEQMDKWYHDAYEERRAPRGALLVNAAHDEELRQLNRQQMDEMRNDPNYIPLFMNDSQEEGDPIKFVELLQDPAAMQHMEMREWFLDRISAFYGVTSVLMKGSPEDSGLSQSMEVQVSQKASDRHREIMNDTFVRAMLAQIGCEGWNIEIAPVEVEDEREEAELVGQHLNNAQKALEMGREVEWTPEDRADIKSGEMEAPGQDEEGMLGGLEGMGGMVGGIPGDEGPDPQSLEPGQDPNEPQPEGSRVEGPDDPDRPSASPLKGKIGDLPEEMLEKVAAKSFELDGVRPADA